MLAPDVHADLNGSSLLWAPPLAILPYARGLYQPDLLYHWWRLLFTQGLLERILYFWEPERRSALESVLGYFSDTRLFLVYREHELVGGVWFNEVQPWQGNIGIAYSRHVRGPFAREATDRVCRAAFEGYGWDLIWGFTPWRSALEHGLRIGFSLVATLPDHVRFRGQRRPLYIGRRTAPCRIRASDSVDSPTP